MTDGTKVCIYDNPATFAREAWMNGKLRGHTQATVLLSKGFNGGSWWPFYFNCGPWTPGRVIGDKEAINEQ